LSAAVETKEQLIDAVEKAAAKRTLFSGGGSEMKL
jgi:hypothetical protein